MSRPTMSRMIRSSVISSRVRVDTVDPSRITVTRSATRRISFSLWLMMIWVTPCALSSSIRSSSLALSFSCSAAVGSSRISSRTSLASALAISISCCLPTPRLPTGVVGASDSPTLASSSRVRFQVRFQSMMPPEATSLPRNMFSATDSCGTSASSWWMMMMPRASLSRMVRKAAVWPS